MNRIGIAVALAGFAVFAAGCHRGKAPGEGSYALTCRNTVKSADGTLTADCLDAHNQYHTSSIAAAACRADIANINGVLTCSAP